MRKECTNVGVVKDVRQLNGISSSGGDVELRRRDEFAAYVVRERSNNWEGSGQHARVGVCNATRNASSAHLSTDGSGETVDGRFVHSQYVELVMGLVTAVPD